MGQRIAREEILRRLKKTIEEGKPIIGAGCSAGIISKCAEAGGADLIMVYSTGLSRIKGFPTTMVPDSNNITLGMYDEISNVVKDTPIIAGVEATEPPAGRDLAELVKRFTNKGFSGIINFPTVGVLEDDNMRNRLIKSQGPEHAQQIRDLAEETKQKKAMGMDFSTELNMVRICRNMDIFTIAYVFNSEDAQAMAEAGVDCMIAHVGATSGGIVGFTTRSYEEAAAKAQEMIEATKKVNPDVICLAHGGPFAGPEDTRYLYEHSDAQGFVGASSIERIPVERAVIEVVKEFKSIPLKKR